MGVFINNLNLSSSGAKIIALLPNGNVEDVTGSVIGTAIEIGKHGRLGDLDAVMRNLIPMQQAQQHLVARGIRKSIGVVRDTPTIIPEEK